MAERPGGAVEAPGRGAGCLHRPGRPAGARRPRRAGRHRPAHARRVRPHPGGGARRRRRPAGPAGAAAAGGGGGRRGAARPADHREDRRHGLLPRCSPGRSTWCSTGACSATPPGWSRTRSAGSARSAPSIGAVLLVAAVLVLMTLAVLRLSRPRGPAPHRRRPHRRRARRRLGRRARVVSACRSPPAARPPCVQDRVGQVRAGLQDQQAFATEAAVDAFRDTPADQLLTGLRGKDVVFAFVESYGRVRGRGPGVRDAGRTRCSTPGPAGWARPASPPAAPSSPRRPSAAAAGWPTPRCCPGCGSTTSSATAAWSRATG